MAGCHRWPRATKIICVRRVFAKVNGNVLKSVLRSAMLYDLKAGEKTEGGRHEDDEFLVRKWQGWPT